MVLSGYDQIHRSCITYESKPVVTVLEITNLGCALFSDHSYNLGLNLNKLIIVIKYVSVSIMYKKRTINR